MRRLRRQAPPRRALGSCGGAPPIRLHRHRERCNGHVMHLVVRLARGDSLHSESGGSERACDRIGAVLPEESQDFVGDSCYERNADHATHHSSERIKSTEEREAHKADEDHHNKKLGAAARVCRWPSSEFGTSQRATVLQRVNRTMLCAVITIGSINVAAAPSK